MMTMAQGARETRTAATANSVTAAAGAAGDYLTNEEAYKMLRGANSGVKPELGHRLYRVVKRTVDIVAAGGALVLLFIPGVILSVVICIKSPGASPLYSQWRVGRVRKDGTFYLFKIYKFRSMVPNADQMLKDLQAQNEATGPMFKMKHDPRIIPGVGNFIRKHSIDELPQLIVDRLNVELSSILGKYDVVYMSAQKLVQRSNECGVLPNSGGNTDSPS